MYLHHERDEFGSRLLGGEDEIALVLAVLVVDDDDGLARRDVGYRPFDGIQPRHPCHPCRPNRDLPCNRYT